MTGGDGACGPSQLGGRVDADSRIIRGNRIVSASRITTHDQLDLRRSHRVVIDTTVIDGAGIVVAVVRPLADHYVVWLDDAEVLGETARRDDIYPSNHGGSHHAQLRKFDGSLVCSFKGHSGKVCCIRLDSSGNIFSLTQNGELGSWGKDGTLVELKMIDGIKNENNP